MANVEYKIEKLYCSISEVAEMFNVNSSLIRYWDKEFTVLHPKKNKKGNRMFMKKDIETFRLIYHLVKERRLTLDGAKLALNDQRDETVKKFEVVQKLKTIKTELLSISRELNVL